MRPLNRAPFLAAAAAVALSLAGCAAYAPSASSGASTGNAAPAATGSAPPSSTTATPTATPTAASTATPSPSTPVPGMVTYTFPDGRLSFSHPADWRVKYEQVSASPLVETASVLDAGGNGRVNVYYGQVGDAGPAPAARFMLEVDPVPGLVGRAVPTPHSSFYVDHVNGAVQYRLGLTSGLPVSPDGTLQTGPVMLDDRILSADVLFTGQPFADDGAAKAWYWSGEGQALKSILMSFSYR